MKLNRSYYRIYAGAKNMFAELCVKQGFIGGDWGIAQDVSASRKKLNFPLSGKL